MAEIIPIRILRGTKAQLTSHGNLDAGELILVTDESCVYVGDGGANYLIGRVLSGVSNPVGNGVAGQMYVNTTTSGTFFSTGGGWISVGTGQGIAITDLDDVPDGSVYGRVKASELTTGYVSKLNDGSHSVTAEQASDHIADSTIHRSIDDETTSLTGLWSSQKVYDQIGSAVRGIDWQESVLDKDLSDPPGTPDDGDRYIVMTSGINGWSGHDEEITEYVTASGGWVFVPLSEGQATWVEDENVLYVYNGASWVKMSSVTSHNILAGLQGGTTNEYYHLTAQDYNELVTNRDEYFRDAIIAPMVSGTQTGVAVTYHEPTDTFNFILSYGTEPGSVSSSSSGQAGSSESVSRADHSHDLGTHAHTGATDGGQIAHSALGSVGANDHHNQSHAIDGGDHTVTTTSGFVMRATSGSTFAFAALQASDLPTHAFRHQHGGNDEIATATPAANAIPKAGADNKLATGWIPTIDAGDLS